MKKNQLLSLCCFVVVLLISQTACKKQADLVQQVPTENKLAALQGVPVWQLDNMPLGFTDLQQKLSQGSVSIAIQADSGEPIYFNLQANKSIHLTEAGRSVNFATGYAGSSKNNAASMIVYPDKLWLSFTKAGEEFIIQPQGQGYELINQTALAKKALLLMHSPAQTDFKQCGVLETAMQEEGVTTLQSPVFRSSKRAKTLDIILHMINPKTQKLQNQVHAASNVLLKSLQEIGLYQDASRMGGLNDAANELLSRVDSLTKPVLGIQINVILKYDEPNPTYYHDTYDYLYTWKEFVKQHYADLPGSPNKIYVALSDKNWKDAGKAYLPGLLTNVPYAVASLIWAQTLAHEVGHVLGAAHNFKTYSYQGTDWRELMGGSPNRLPVHLSESNIRKMRSLWQ